MQKRGGGVSSHKEMLRKKFDTVSYYDHELHTQPGSWSVFGKKNELKAMLLGLDDAGKVFFLFILINFNIIIVNELKTTILYQMVMGEVVQTIPTVGKISSSTRVALEDILMQTFLQAIISRILRSVG